MMARTPKKTAENRHPREQGGDDEFLILRRSLAARMPAMLDGAIGAYDRIATDFDTADPKAISSMHSAAKATLAHIEQVIRVAEWVLNMPEADRPMDGGDAESLLMLARKSLEDGRSGQNDG